MTANRSTSNSPLPAIWPALLITGGTGLVLLSLLSSGTKLSRARWSQQQAQKYQASSVKLHDLSLRAVHAGPDANPAVRRKDLEEAAADYQAIRAELDSAINRPHSIATALRYLGATLILGGGVGLLYLRSRS